MANVRTNSRSFSGGAIASELYGRIDLVKYATGLATARNFITLPHGPAVNRPGTVYVNGARFNAKKSRIIPFTYSTDQTMIIELAENCLRFHTQGATLLSPNTAWSGVTAYAVGDPVRVSSVNYYCILPHTNHTPPNATYWYAMSGTAYEVPTTYLEAELFDIDYVQSNDVLTIVHTAHPVATLNRLGATQWTLTASTFGSTSTAPTGVTATATLGGTPGTPTTQGYLVTTIGPDGQESVASDPASGSAFTITAADWTNGEITISGSAATDWEAGNYIKISGLTNPLGGNATYIVDSASGATDLVLRILGGGVLSEPSWGTSIVGTPIATQMGVRNNLNDAGARNVIRWSAVSGAARYYVYKNDNGLFGFIGTTDQTLFVDDNIAADISITPPTNSNPFTGAGNYPRAVSYFEQRKVFGGTLNNPQTLWFTRPGTEANLNVSAISQDGDAISFKVAAREANTILHLMPMQALVPLTQSAEWRVESVNNDALTPTSISVKPQSSIGSNNVQPVLTNSNMVYAAARGGHLREMLYSFEQAGYITGDLSRFNPTLFDTYTLLDMAHAKSPYPIVWSIRSDGTLIGLTYVPEEQVSGLHQHDTGGEDEDGIAKGYFESVACVAEGDEDATYFVVKRIINGSTVRYIERMATRLFDTQAEAFFVDCGVSYSGAPISTVTSGLSHLIGEAVNILGDGAVMPPQVVNGSGGLPSALDGPCSDIQIGLPITADVQTLPVALEIDGLGQGRSKNVNKVWVRVNRSSGIFAGPDLTDLTQYKQRTTEPYGTPPGLVSEELEIIIQGSWTDGGQIWLRQTDPLPLTIVSITAEVSLG